MSSHLHLFAFKRLLPLTHDVCSCQEFEEEFVLLLLPHKHITMMLVAPYTYSLEYDPPTLT